MTLCQKSGVQNRHVGSRLWLGNDTVRPPHLAARRRATHIAPIFVCRVTLCKQQSHLRGIPGFTRFQQPHLDRLLNFKKEIIWLDTHIATDFGTKYERRFVEFQLQKNDMAIVGTNPRGSPSLFIGRIYISATTCLYRFTSVIPFDTNWNCTEKIAMGPAQGCQAKS